MLTVEMAPTLLRETDTKSFLVTQDTPSLRLAWDWPTVNAKSSRKAQGNCKELIVLSAFHYKNHSTKVMITRSAD